MNGTFEHSTEAHHQVESQRILAVTVNEEGPLI